MKSRMTRELQGQATLLPSPASYDESTAPQLRLVQPSGHGDIRIIMKKGLGAYWATRSPLAQDSGGCSPSPEVRSQTGKVRAKPQVGKSRCIAAAAAAAAAASSCR